MDFRQIDKILQAEYAVKKITAEQEVSENLKKVNSNLTYKDFSNIEIQGSFTGNDNVPLYISKRKNFKSEEYM